VLLQESANAFLSGPDLPFIQQERPLRERWWETRQPGGGARSFLGFLVQAERATEALQGGPTGRLRIIELNRASEGFQSPPAVTLGGQTLAELLLRLSGMRASSHPVDYRLQRRGCKKKRARRPAAGRSELIDLRS